MRRIYMDYAAGAPVDGRVLEAMAPFFTLKYGNPSSSHYFGNEAKRAISEARNRVASLIGAERDEEIIFTSGGTESNNLAIMGLAYRNRPKGDHVITSSIEHMSVINAFKHLSKQGFRVTYIPVDRYGILDIGELEKKITEKTVLVSVMYANGEIGTIEPIKEIGEIAHSKAAYFHVDAVAAAGQIPIDVEKENIDLLSLSSNDMYGPRGVGALYIRAGTPIQPIMFGGGQERGLRSGTENLPGIVGMGKAAEIAKNEMTKEAERLSILRDEFIKGVLDSIPESYLNGHRTKRLPNNVNIRFSYVEGESLILSLDMEGVACSSGSACTSKTLEPSHVLMAIGLKHEEAHGSLLFTLGRQNNENDVKYVLDILPGIVRRLRAISPLTPKNMIL
ncbi:cysteine desulfurase NifS [Candidatus Bathyarchaeota archaeon]|nr:cysteine desulfurase NifS [Candidatus Bathyarchaeota archaeon]MBS7629053.1 cysteine desulfurase NifS [Candidatus Bathyarchaeota archaeon]